MGKRCASSHSTSSRGALTLFSTGYGAEREWQGNSCQAILLLLVIVPQAAVNACWSKNKINRTTNTRAPLLGSFNRAPLSLFLKNEREPSSPNQSRTSSALLTTISQPYIAEREPGKNLNSTKAKAIKSIYVLKLECLISPLSIPYQELWNSSINYQTSNDSSFLLTTYSPYIGDAEYTLYHLLMECSPSANV